MTMSKRDRTAWDAETATADTARLLVLLSQAQQQELLRRRQEHERGHVGHGVAPRVAAVAGGGGRVFECKTCSRQFPTFQALGGHRASHKRPKLLQQHTPASDDHAGRLCLGRHPPMLPPRPPQQFTAAPKPRVHACPVCGLEFAIGQALGGHMRRHRAEADAEITTPIKLPPASEKVCDVAGGICLDLNLTPSENCTKCRNVAGLGAAGPQGVHKALAMLDCSL